MGGGKVDTEVSSAVQVPMPEAGYHYQWSAETWASGDTSLGSATETDLTLSEETEDWWRPGSA